MSTLAQKIIAENKELYSNGGDATVLNLGNCGLTQVPNEVFDCHWVHELVLSSYTTDFTTGKLTSSPNTLKPNKLRQIPDKIGSLRHLKKLHIAGTYEGPWDISDLQFLDDLESLEYLNIAYNKIERIGKIGWLESLKYLDISHNNVEDLSPLSPLNQILHLNAYYNNIVEVRNKDLPVQLRYLNLGLNNIKEIGFIKLQRSIESLHLQNNGIDNIDSLSTLISLRNLTLSGNLIEDISPLQNLTNLTTLGLSGNKEADCQFLSKLSALESLHLSENKIKNIDAITTSLTSLRNLTLSKCQISDVPDLQKLTKLRWIDLSDNLISSCEFIHSMDHLFDLDLSNNNLKKFIVGADFPNLHHLDLRGNGLTKIDGLEKCSQLRRLNLGNNKLQNCEAFELCPSIDYIDISENDIYNLEPLVRLPALRHLDVSRNPLSDISFLQNCLELKSLSINGIKGLNTIVLFQLTRLTSLSLDSCQIEDFTQIAKLQELESLSARYNGLTNLNWASKLRRLKRLDLQSNNIEDISIIAGLRELQYLNLSDNDISNVPLKLLLSVDLEPSFSNVERYAHGKVYLGNNPIEFPSIDILSQGREFAVKFLKASNKRPLNECKVILLGKGGVGKTTLQKALMSVPVDLHEPETHGIRKVSWRNFVKASDSGFVRVNFWDFGGQHIQQALHQFFYSKNTVYILVLDRRKEDDPEDFLELVRGYGSNSPVIVVYNNKMADSATYDLSPTIDSTLLNKYPNIVKPIFGINCVEFEDPGVNRLRDFLANYIPHLDHVRAEYPNNWLTIKTELLERVGTNYLLYNDYQKICQEHNLEEEAIQKGLAEMLATVGTITFFDRPFGDNYYVLNPDWLTTGAYQIILSDITRQNKGRIRIDDLVGLLNGDDSGFIYTKQDVKILLDLMSAFDLCHRFQNQNEWLIPSSLEGESKMNLIDFRTESTFRYAIKYQTALPSSVIHRFIVRNIRFSSGGDYWRNGIVLKHPNSDTLMYVEADAKDKEIRLYIRGPMIVECWEFFRKDFRELSEKFEFDELIILDTGNVVSYQLLLDARHAGKTHIFIGGRTGDIDVRETLGLFETEKNVQKSIIESNSREIGRKYKLKNFESSMDKLFISYAHSDNEFGQVDLFELELRRALPKNRYEIFKDDQIIVGEDWSKRLLAELETARVGILLLTHAFFDSGYITQTELVTFLRRLELNDCLVCPVFFGPFDVSEADAINNLQFFKPSGRNYGKEFAAYGDKLSYNHFIRFHPGDGRILPSPERTQYVVDFVSALKKADTR